METPKRKVEKDFAYKVMYHVLNILSSGKGKKVYFILLSL